MSNATYPNGKIRPYSHLTDPLSLLHNHYWIHSHNYQFPDCVQQLYFPLFQYGRDFTRIQTCVIIYIASNNHFWPSTCIVNLCQPLYFFIWQNLSSHYLNIIHYLINIIMWINLLFISKCTFHKFPSLLHYYCPYLVHKTHPRL